MNLFKKDPGYALNFIAELKMKNLDESLARNLLVSK